MNRGNRLSHSCPAPHSPDSPDFLPGFDWRPPEAGVVWSWTCADALFGPLGQSTVNPRILIGLPLNWLVMSVFSIRPSHLQHTHIVGMWVCCCSILQSVDICETFFSPSVCSCVSQVCAGWMVTQDLPEMFLKVETFVHISYHFLTCVVPQCVIFVWLVHFPLNFTVFFLHLIPWGIILVYSLGVKMPKCAMPYCLFYSCPFAASCMYCLHNQTLC